MLVELRVRDFAIIESLEVEFGPGLTVLSGETGAGKSILIDALALALGSRASAEDVRSQAEQAELEARFALADSEAARELAAAQGHEGDELLVRRQVGRTGKNRVWINGSGTTQAALFDLGRKLVDIYGQHEYQTLLQSERHLSLLDAFGGLEGEAAAYREAFRRRQALLDEEAGLRRSEAEKQERREILEFRIKEIERVKPRPGEDEELKQEKERLRHAEQLQAAAGEGAERIYDGDGAVAEELHGLVRKLEAAAVHDPALKRQAERLAESSGLLEETGRELRAYADRVESDPARLQEADDRLAEIQRLKRKYGETIELVLAALAAARRERESLDHAEERLAALARELEVAKAECLALGLKLSGGRKKAAAKLAQQVEAELKDLDMARTRFEARLLLVAAEDGLAPQGLESVEFYLSPNPGEELKPLAKIASGGELSRIMLALRTLLAAPGGAKTLVFDEVDAGIGGRTAEVVGRKLKALSRDCQVLCVTHLPQIAAYADRHFQVKKGSVGGRTLTSIGRLSEAERVEELSRMLGGVKITETTRAHAREMIESAGRVRKGSGK